MPPDLQLLGSNIWPPTTGQWAFYFCCIFAAIMLLLPWWKGRLLFDVTLLCAAGALAVVIVRTDARLAVVSLILILTGATVSGSAILHLLGFRGEDDLNILEWMGFGALLGLGLYSLLAGAFAVIRILNTWTALLIIVATPSITFRFARTFRTITASSVKGLRAARSGIRRLPAFAAAAFFVFALFPFTWALAPSVHWDALAGHLPLAGALTSPEGFARVSNFWFSYVPGESHLLFALGLAAAGQPLPALIHFSFGAITTLLVVALGRRIGGPVMGWLAGLGFASMPVVGWAAGTAYIDLFVTAFGFASIYALLRWGQTEFWPNLLLAATLFGLAMGAKASAAFLLPGALFYIVVVTVRKKLCSNPFQPAFIYASAAILFCLPWWVRNWYWKHNPFYPSMATFFHNPEAATLTFNWSLFGVGKGPVYFLRLPYDLVVHGHAFDESGFLVFGFVPLAAVVGAFLLFSGRWKAVRPLAFFAGATALVWFLVGQVARYLLPVAPAFAVLAAVPAVAIFEARKRLPARIAIVVVACAGVLSLIYLRAITTKWNYNIADGYPYRYALGLESREAFLNRALRMYKTLQHLNSETSADTKIYSPSSEMRWYSTALIEDPIYRLDLAILAGLPPGRPLAEEIRKRGFAYVLVDLPLLHNAGPFTDEHFLKENMELDYSSSEIRVYKLRGPGTAPAVSTANLLENSGFDDLDANDGPRSWSTFGNPRLVKAPRKAHSLPAFVEVTQEDGYMQRALASPGKLYTVKLWARSDLNNQSVWLQILWFDQAVHVLGTSISAAPVSAEWKEYSASFTAEDVATAFAQVYARAASGNRVQVDDVRLLGGW